MGLFLRNENLIIIFSFFLIFSVGIYLCFIGGYGSDEDTLPMIYAFETTLYDGRFVSSRFTGNPVAEIGIGFLSVYFGSFVANLFTYLFLILGLVLFYFSFNTLKISKEIYLFLFLCLTNPILFFDNLEPVDYSWALFFRFCTSFVSPGEEMISPPLSIDSKVVGLVASLAMSFCLAFCLSI